MSFFSKLFNDSDKEIIPLISFSKYPQIKHLTISETAQYNNIRQITNSSLNDFHRFYKKEFKADADKRNFLEMTCFTWAVFQPAFEHMQLLEKIEITLDYSIREAFISLSKEITNSGFPNIDSFIRSRVAFYRDRINELMEKDTSECGEKSLSLYGTIYGTLTVNALSFIRNNDPMYIEYHYVPGVDATMRFSSFIVSSLQKSTERISKAIK